MKAIRRKDDAISFQFCLLISNESNKKLVGGASLALDKNVIPNFSIKLRKTETSNKHDGQKFENQWPLKLLV